MLFLFVGVGFAVLLWISFLAIGQFNGEPNEDWRSLSSERLRVEDNLCRFVEERGEPSPLVYPPSSHPKSGAFWEALQSQHVGNALSIAEEAMATHRDNPQARLLLAMALLENKDFDAANGQLSAAISLGAEGGFSSYLSARLEIEQYLHSIEEKTATSQNSILMPVELLALELHLRLGDSNDAASLWMPGQNTEISQEEARSFVVSHFSGYYRLIDSMIASLQDEEYAEGVYLLARIALKCGFSKEGSALLMDLEERMKASHNRRSFQRDLAILRGERPVSTESVSSGGRKMIKLNVLN